LDLDVIKNPVKRTIKQINWGQLSDEELMKMRIRDFNLSIDKSPIKSMIKKLYKELDAGGISFHPLCYFADEWLCPDREPIIGIPFYLAHPRLSQIEQKMMFEVEGGTETSFMQLLRHEAGHALNYAYEFYKKTRWRQLFGSFSTKYSNSYYFQPYSKRFVRHLGDNYAQAHPDEDFAETFAVWLTPDISWERKYQSWPVMKKLMYVDNLVKNISGKSPVRKSIGNPPWSASRMTSTLAGYYERKRKLLGEEFKGFYDDTLMKLFSTKRISLSKEKASKVVRRNRRELVNNISECTGHRKYDVRRLIDKLIQRCDMLELYGQQKDIMGVAVLITTIASNTLRIPPKK
jgi:hypothetical protein